LTESIINNLSLKKNPEPDTFTEVYHTFKEKLKSVLSKLFQKLKNRIFSNSFYKANIAPIPKPNKDTIRKVQILVRNIAVKILNSQIIVNMIIVNNDHVGFIPGMQG
jgi:hypothetical protein